MDRGRCVWPEKSMERTDCGSVAGGTAVCDMRPARHILPSHEGRRVQRTLCCGEYHLESVRTTLTYQAFLPLVLALYHSLRHPNQRQYPAWSADSQSRNPLDRLLNFLYDSSTRYIVPAFLLSVSSFLVTVKAGILRSTYICPVANSTAATIPTLQFIAFLVDCFIAQAVYRLVDDGVSPTDDWTIHLKEGTSNHKLVGLK